MSKYLRTHTSRCRRKPSFETAAWPRCPPARCLVLIVSLSFSCATSTNFDSDGSAVAESLITSPQVLAPETTPATVQLMSDAESASTTPPATISIEFETTATARASARAVQDPFVAMWDLDPEGGVPSSEDWGELWIDPPCVYLDVTIEESDLFGYRYLLSLPRSITRYDRHSGGLWVWAAGPHLTGDRVSVGGGASTAAEAMGWLDPASWTTCSFDGVFIAHSMHADQY